MDWTLDYGETHLRITSDTDSKETALDELIRNYDLLVHYINKNPLYKASYEPVPVEDGAPEIVRLMAAAASAANVGPMAAVAGAFSDLVSRRIITAGAKDLIVENGGDIFIKAAREKVVGIYAGPSKLSGKFALRVRPQETPCGICTSSASVGPSISLGKADSATGVADTAALADAAASAIGNAVQAEKDMENALKTAKGIPGLRGAIIIKGETLAAWGRLPKIINAR